MPPRGLRACLGWLVCVKLAPRFRKWSVRFIKTYRPGGVCVWFACCLCFRLLWSWFHAAQPSHWQHWHVLSPLPHWSRSCMRLQTWTLMGEKGLQVMPFFLKEIEKICTTWSFHPMRATYKPKGQYWIQGRLSYYESSKKMERIVEGSRLPKTGPFITYIT